MERKETAYIHKKKDETEVSNSDEEEEQCTQNKRQISCFQTIITDRVHVYISKNS